MMSKKSLLALLVVSLFITTAIPTATAYKGYQLSRAPVEDFSLIDQNNQDVNLTDSRGDVVIVAFIFTRCPDVCPVITQLLRSVESGIGADYEEHVSIVSMSTALSGKKYTPSSMSMARKNGEERICIAQGLHCRKIKENQGKHRKMMEN